MTDDEKAMLDLGYCFDSEPHLCMAATFCAFRDRPKAEQVLSLEALREANVARQAAWCPDQQPDLSFRGNELGGECGEAQNVIKKLERERLGWAGSRDTLEHLAEELADVVICADLCAMTAGVDLAGAVVAKFNATSEKVGLPHRLGEACPQAGWQPIETAPKDGTVIDVWRSEGGRETVRWGMLYHECGEMGGLCDDDWHSIRAPGWVCNTFDELVGRQHNPFTHWRPLPGPPGRDDAGQP